MSKPVYLEPLTPKELEVLELWATGWTSPQIAKQFGNSHRTIEGIVVNIKGKTGCTDRREAFTYFLERILKPRIIDEHYEHTETIKTIYVLDDCLSVAGLVC